MPSTYLAISMQAFWILQNLIFAWLPLLGVSMALGQRPPLENPFDFLPDETSTLRQSAAAEPTLPAESPALAEATEVDPPATIDETGEAASPIGAGPAASPPPEAANGDAPPSELEQGPRPAATQPAFGQPPAAVEPLAVEGPPVEDAAADGPAANRPDRFNKAVMIHIDGEINDRFAWFLNQRLDWAEDQAADLVILRLTSPGGYMHQSIQLARRLQAIDWATTVVLIPEEAISGGAIIALGCDRIYMLDGALLGDAAPIELKLGGQFEHVPQKILSYLLTAVAELASEQQRPVALVQAMVDMSITVLEATDRQTGQRSFVTQQQADDPQVQKRYVIGRPVPETQKGHPLTVAAARAAELQLCDGVFASESGMLEALQIQSLIRTEMTWVDKTVFVLNRPLLTGLLLIVGLIGLYLELAAPGLSVAGLVALFSFGIFFWSHILGGDAGWLEVVMFILGVVCLICELFVLPGFGVFGIAGVGLVVFSLVMASQDFVIPDSTAEWTQLRGNVLLVLGAVCGVMVLFVGQLLLLDSLPGLTRFQLGAPPAADPLPERSITSLTGGAIQTSSPLAIGQFGLAASDLRPSGKVTIDDRLIDVVTEGDYVDAGSSVEVMRIEGNRVVVRKKG